MSRYNLQRRYPNKSNDNDLFVACTFYVSKRVHNIIKQISNDTGQPFARLVAMAVDNELDTANPFNYPCVIPDNYTEFEFSAEAGKVADFLMKCPKGAALEVILLARRDIDIPKRSDVLGGVKELLEKGMVEIFTSINGSGSAREERLRLRDCHKPARAPRFKRIETEKSRYAQTISDKDIDRDEEE